jgi:hypothetical protein
LQRVLSTVVLLGLLVATAAAFAITEHLKLEKSPISGTRVTKEFSPVCGCATDRATIRIKLRHSGFVTVTIEDSSRHTVATLATHVHRRKGFAKFFWGGKTDAGGTVSHGTFQQQVKLANRTILLPNKIVVDTVAPKVQSASDGRGFLVPGGKRTLDIRYALSEKAHPAVFLGGNRIVLGHHTRTHGVIKWNGKRHHRQLRDGRYVLEIGAVDLAGNATPASERKQVVVVLRAISVLAPGAALRPRARFTVGVQTASHAYTWRLGSASGTGRRPKLHLRAPKTRGTYRLVVKANGHTASATIKVGRK